MKRNSGYAFIAALLALCLVPVGAAFGQNSAWGVDADVDGDGDVTVTDVQQVINGTLGVTEAGREATRLRVRQYVVAAPRACLTSASVVDGDDSATGDDSACCAIRGDVFNFPRADGRLLVRAGTAVVFRLARGRRGRLVSRRVRRAGLAAHCRRPGSPA